MERRAIRTDASAPKSVTQCGHLRGRLCVSHRREGKLCSDGLSAHQGQRDPAFDVPDGRRRNELGARDEGGTDPPQKRRCGSVGAVRPRGACEEARAKPGTRRLAIQGDDPHEAFLGGEVEDVLRLLSEHHWPRRRQQEVAEASVEERGVAQGEDGAVSRQVHHLQDNRGRGRKVGGGQPALGGRAARVPVAPAAGTRNPAPWHA